MKCTIFPLEKVEIGGATVSLGMSKDEVKGILGSPEDAFDDDDGGECHYYHGSEFSISYDKSGSVVFIEFLAGIDGSLKPMIYGVSAFDVMADELCAVLEKNNAGEIEDEDGGYSYAYKEISVGIYRDSRPEDAEECIEEMRADGNYSEEAAENERRIANHWATIGFGVKGYYR